MSTMPSVGSGTYSPGPNMVCSPEQEKVGTGSIEAIICPVYSDLRIRATVSKLSVRCSCRALKTVSPERQRVLIREIAFGLRSWRQPLVVTHPDGPRPRLPCLWSFDTAALW